MNKKQKSQLIILSAAIALLVILYIVANRNTSQQGTLSQPSPQSGTNESAAGTFHGIPPEGDGGDAMLNKLKNRWSAPVSATPMSVDEIIGFTHNDLDNAGRGHRGEWSDDALAQASGKEKLGVTVEGYLIAAKESGPESCNGHSDIYRDFHIWIGSSPDAAKSESIIVEMTPFWKEQYPEWTLRRLESEVSSHPKMRVTGWMLWDEEHPDEVGRSRGSQWEVHPVTKFEEIGGN
ncbi:MAG TPA: hypothetical protein VEW28_09805 [Candidatus Kapabacteria bacterium]|nr:hypothetical protein [Candidatus Kapabacteria bacterium]